MKKTNANDLHLVFNGLYTADSYKKNYIIARSILCDAENFIADDEMDLEKCILIYNMYTSVRDIYCRRSLHTFEYKGIDFNSQEFIRKAFPRKKKWNKKNMRLANYEVAYKTLHPMVPDADNFGLFEHIRETDVEKCKWIAAICEVLDDVPVRRVKHIFEHKNVDFDYQQFLEDIGF